MKSKPETKEKIKLSSIGSTVVSEGLETVEDEEPFDYGVDLETKLFETRRKQLIDRLRKERHDLLSLCAGPTLTRKNLHNMSRKMHKLNKKLFELTGDPIYTPT